MILVSFLESPHLIQKRHQPAELRDPHRTRGAMLTASRQKNASPTYETFAHSAFPQWIQWFPRLLWQGDFCARTDPSPDSSFSCPYRLSSPWKTVARVFK